MLRFFAKCDTLEQLKAEYKRLAMRYHPDRDGGDEETMKAVNAEYDDVFDGLKSWHRNAKGERYEKATNEAPHEFRDLIEKLIRIPNITIEIIGSFVWVSGDTKSNKDAIKALGFKWHAKKAMWYLSPPGYKRKTRRNMSMDEIRDSFGVSYTAETGSTSNPLAR